MTTTHTLRTGTMTVNSDLGAVGQRFAYCDCGEWTAPLTSNYVEAFADHLSAGLVVDRPLSDHMPSVTDITSRAPGVLPDGSRCSTCAWPHRSTVDGVCQTCGTDYATVDEPYGPPRPVSRLVGWEPAGTYPRRPCDDCDASAGHPCMHVTGERIGFSVHESRVVQKIGGTAMVGGSSGPRLDDVAWQTGPEALAADQPADHVQMTRDWLKANAEGKWNAGEGSWPLGAVRRSLTGLLAAYDHEHALRMGEQELAEGPELRAARKTIAEQRGELVQLRADKIAEDRGDGPSLLDLERQGNAQLRRELTLTRQATAKAQNERDAARRTIADQQAVISSLCGNVAPTVRTPGPLERRGIEQLEQNVARLRADLDEMTQHFHNARKVALENGTAWRNADADRTALLIANRKARRMLSKAAKVGE